MTPEAQSEGLERQLADFTDFIDQPPSYENRRTVREYRHALWRKWWPLFRAIRAALSQAQRQVSEDESAATCNDLRI